LRALADSGIGLLAGGFGIPRRYSARGVRSKGASFRNAERCSRRRRGRVPFTRSRGDVAQCRRPCRQAARCGRVLVYLSGLGARASHWRHPGSRPKPSTRAPCRGRRLVGLVAKSGSPLAVEHARQHPQFRFFPERRGSLRVADGGTLVVRDVTIGVLVVQTVNPRHFLRQTSSCSRPAVSSCSWC